jgi:hypothetical protein
VIVCALAVYESGRIGFARTNAAVALTLNGTAAAERAVRLSPRDAEVHAARGVVLQRTEEYAEGCRELERAIQLRPRDYFLWTMLGVTRDLNGDQSGGVDALRQSVEQAPAYAKPRWLLGNLLLRTGDIDEGLQQLRLAAESDQSLLPAVTDLAWGISNNNADRTIAWLQPRTDEAHMVMATFLANHEQGSAAIDQFRKVARPDGPAADQLTTRLIDRRSFAEAFEVWTKLHCASCKAAAFVNGGFESDIDMDTPGFDWRIATNTAGVVVSIDPAEHAGGARSLNVDFHGNSTPQISLISQTLLVQAGTRYRVSLQAMTRSFVSAAGPVVHIIDASDPKFPILGQAVIATNVSGWQPYTISFTTGPNTRAVQIVIERADCPTGSCAAFGTLWLDSFQIE